MGFEPTTPTLAGRAQPLNCIRAVPGETSTALGGHHDHEAIGNCIMADRTAHSRWRSNGRVAGTNLGRSIGLPTRAPAKLLSMSAASRPCSRSLIPQKLPKKWCKRTSYGVSI